MKRTSKAKSLIIVSMALTAASVCAAEPVVSFDRGIDIKGMLQEMKEVEESDKNTTVESVAATTNTTGNATNNVQGAMFYGTAGARSKLMTDEQAGNLPPKCVQWGTREVCVNQQVCRMVCTVVPNGLASQGCKELCVLVPKCSSVPVCLKTE